MSPKPLDVLVIADLHYTSLARHHCPLPERHSVLVPMLLDKAVARLGHLGITPGLIILLGDLVDNGDAPQAGADLALLAGKLQQRGLPLLALPGNHDGNQEHLARLFNSPPGLHRIGGYGFLLFHDHPLAGEVWQRPAHALELPATVAAAEPQLPLIALQHHPLYPAIEAPYPYMLDNTAAVLQSYTAGGISLSLSGHYHVGQPLREHAGVAYATTPSLSQAPFSFQHLRLEGRSFELTTHTLQVPLPGLSDVHAHTEFAYCATTVTASHNGLLAEALGLEKQALTEHAYHLYFPRDIALRYDWQRDRKLADDLWEHDPQRGRMAAYRAFVTAQRSERVRIGLEVDLMAGGELLLHPDDYHGWDLLVGAVHEIGEMVRGVTPIKEVERLFMRDVERLLAAPIQVLAHPFRLFTRHNLPKPTHLYREVARKLAAAGVAAEINFHTNFPEPEFIRYCLDFGVRLALGTDSHCLSEIADLYPHLQLLRSVGIDLNDLAACLYHPD